MKTPKMDKAIQTEWHNSLGKVPADEFYYLCQATLAGSYYPSHESIFKGVFVSDFGLIPAQTAFSPIVGKLRDGKIDGTQRQIWRTFPRVLADGSISLGIAGLATENSIPVDSFALRGVVVSLSPDSQSCIVKVYYNCLGKFARSLNMRVYGNIDGFKVGDFRNFKGLREGDRFVLSSTEKLGFLLKKPVREKVSKH